MADMNPIQLKLASLTEARTTPPQIGSKVRTTARVGISPRKTAESSTLKKGSCVCVDDRNHMNNNDSVGVSGSLSLTSHSRLHA